MAKDNVSTRRLRSFLRRINDGPNSGRLDSIFERHGVDKGEGIDALVKEIRLDGANTIASVFRGWEGVQYDQIVIDVASQMKLEVNDESDELTIERKIVEALMSQYLDEADEDDLSWTDDYLKKKSMDGEATSLPEFLEELKLGKIGGATLAAVASGLALRRLGLGIGALIPAGFSLAVPLLNIAMVSLAIVDVAGPAFRKTAPTVVEIALLRLEFNGLGS